MRLNNLLLALMILSPAGFALGLHYSIGELTFISIIYGLGSFLGYMIIND